MLMKQTLFASTHVFSIVHGSFHDDIQPAVKQVTAFTILIVKHKKESVSDRYLWHFIIYIVEDSFMY